MKKTVCYQCKERKMGCHASCERYIEEDKIYQAEKQRIKDAKELERNLSEYEWNNRQAIRDATDYHRRQEKRGRT